MYHSSSDGSGIADYVCVASDAHICVYMTGRLTFLRSGPVGNEKKWICIGLYRGNPS